jgi:tetratricopeptide (TPR) repeat protein
MNDLGNDARALIELARDAHDPGNEDQARVRAKLASRLGVAAGLGVVAGLGAAAKTTATVGAGTGMAAGAGAGAGAGVTAGTLGAGAAALKLIGAVLVVSATVGAGAVAVHHARRAPAARVAVAEKAAVSSPRRAATGAAALAAPTAPETEPPDLSGPPSDPIQQSRKVHASALPPAVADATEKPAQAHALAPAPTNGLANAAQARAALAARRSAPAVADEASLFHDGIVALRSGQPTRALELFDLHARLYPQGVLAEERDAERALALADLGRTVEARAAIGQFLQRHPASPLAARLIARAHLLDAADGNPGSRDAPAPSVTQRHAP